MLWHIFSSTLLSNKICENACGGGFFFFHMQVFVMQVIKARFWCSGKTVKCQVFIVGKYFVSLMQSGFFQWIRRRKLV